MIDGPPLARLPVVFVLGLLLIPLGWWRYRARTGRPTRELLSQQFTEELVRPRALGSRLLVIIGGLTLANVVFLGAGSARMLHFMDQPVFCGTACHSVMHPEWITYQQSPHAHVDCVECHVGEGTEALVDSKLNGAWQMVSVTFDLYERPIPTPVHNLRPAQETCETCHWPAKFYGQRVRIIPHFGNNQDSTPQYTTLSLKVGAGTGEKRGEIHWHVADENEIRYMPGDPERNTVAWVEVRRQTLAALTGSYPDHVSADDAIDRDFRGFYAREMPNVLHTHNRQIARAVEVLQSIYARNIHPRMNVGWNPYPDHIGHGGKGGCWRCHSPSMVDAEGASVRHSCTLCHSILAYDSETPFAFLSDPKRGDRQYAMHEYLREELLRSRKVPGADAPAPLPHPEPITGADQ